MPLPRLPGPPEATAPRSHAPGGDSDASTRTTARTLRNDSSLTILKGLFAAHRETQLSLEDPGKRWANKQVRQAIERGYFSGRRLQLAGRAITHSRGHIHWAGGVAEKLAASPAYLDLNPQSSGWDTLVLFRA